jgi:hypothetical protein
MLAMTRDDLIFWITLSGVACWAVCFLWMHRISVKQNNLLVQLREQAARIERVAKEEHELIKEVHPQVGDIKAGVEEVIAAVNQSPGSAEKT